MPMHGEKQNSNYYAATDDYYRHLITATSDHSKESMHYVTRWACLASDGSIHAFGADANQRPVHCNMSDMIQPVLLVGTTTTTNHHNQLDFLANIKHVNGAKPIIRWNDECHFASSLIQQLFGDGGGGVDSDRLCCTLWLVPTWSFVSSKLLHRMLTRSHLLIVPTAWTLELMILVQRSSSLLSFLYCVPLMDPMNVPTSPLLEVVAFDIETVSHHDNRVPLGSFASDILFSISIVSNRYDKITMFYLPIEESSSSSSSSYNFPSNVQIFYRECDLLAAALAILESRSSRHYFLLGYNSRAYDMPFLLKRAVYLGMLEEASKFHYDNGILVYGSTMIHIDMLQVIRKYNSELPRFSLKYVAETLLPNDTQARKVDLDAVQLRFAFRSMLMNDDGMMTNSLAEPFPQCMFSFEDMIRYNDMDSLLLLKLWTSLNYDEFIPDDCRVRHLSPTRLAQCAVQEYLVTNHIFTCLHREREISMRAPLVEHVLVHHLNQHLTLDSRRLSTASGRVRDKYVGGLNYRDSSTFQSSVTMMDMVAYYPRLMDGFNLSHETVAIVCKTKALPTIDANEHGVRLFIYDSHKGASSKLEQEVLTRLFVTGRIDNVREIMSTSEPSVPEGTRIMIISQRRKGLLPRIVRRQNNLRELAKESRSAVQFTINTIEAILADRESSSSSSLYMMLDDDDGNAVDNDGDDAEEYQLEPYIVRRRCLLNSDVDWEEELLKCKLVLSNESELEECTSDSLRSYADLLRGEMSRIHSQYRSLKITNSSYYGLLGNIHGFLAGLIVATIVTTLARKYIIDSAKAGARLGLRCILIDTDSLFLSCDETNKSDGNKNSSSKLITQAMEKENSSLLLSAKHYEGVLVMAKKTYIAQHESKIFSRGINKRGPKLWDEVLFDAFSTLSRDVPLTYTEVLPILEQIFRSVWVRVSKDKSLVLCETSCKGDAADYATQVPMKKLLERLQVENPTFVPGKFVRYFYLLRGAPSTSLIEIYYKLDSTPMHMLNLFKFFGKIIKPLYHVINTRLTTTYWNRFNVRYVMTPKTFEKMFEQAFVNVRQENIAASAASNSSSGS